MAKKSAETAGGVASGTPEAMNRIMIPLDLIVMDQDRERLAEDPELDQLVASMRVDGLLQPVGVLELGRTLKHQKHRLVFGHRRFTAAKRLGWKAIEATIVVLPEGFTENDVLQVRAIENLQRKELNPAEEAVMVAQLLDSLAIQSAQTVGLAHLNADEALSHPKVRAEAYRLAAEKLAKSETWVRDRAFIGRLDGKARDMVLSGRLPLAHAREISKIADPALRAEAAVDFSAKESYGRLMQPANLHEVKEFVERHMFSLAQVPWKLDTRFAGKPSCDSCPHNSLNNPGLFDGGASHSVDPRYSKGGFRTTQSREPNSGVCTHEACFKEKAAASNGTLSRVAMKYNREQAKLAVKDRVEPTPKAVASLVPDFLKPTTVAAAAKVRWADMVQSKKPQSATGSAIKPAKAKADPAVVAAEEEFRDAHSKWSRETPVNLIASLKGKPLHLIVLFLLEYTEVIMKADSCHGDKADKALRAPGVLRLINLLSLPSLSLADLTTVASAINVREIENGFGCSIGTDTQDTLIELIDRAVGLGIPRPKLEDFLPKAEPKKPSAKPTPAKASKNKAALVPAPKPAGKAKPGTCSKCGFTENDGVEDWANDSHTLCNDCANAALDGGDA